MVRLERDLVDVADVVQREVLQVKLNVVRLSPFRPHYPHAIVHRVVHQLSVLLLAQHLLRKKDLLVLDVGALRLAEKGRVVNELIEEPSLHHDLRHLLYRQLQKLQQRLEDLHPGGLIEVQPSAALELRSIYRDLREPGGLVKNLDLRVLQLQILLDRGVDLLVQDLVALLE